MQVHWSILRDGDEGKYDYNGVPPVYELCLRFPETLGGCQLWLWGLNYDLRSRGYTCPNEKFEAVKEGDWVRVFGVLCRSLELRGVRPRGWTNYFPLAM